MNNLNNSKESRKKKRKKAGEKLAKPTPGNAAITH